MRRWLVVIAVVFLAGCGGTAAPTATPARTPSPTAARSASLAASTTPVVGSVAPPPSPSVAPPTSTGTASALPAAPSAQPTTAASPTLPGATPVLTPTAAAAPATPGRVEVAVENVGNYRSAFGVLYFIGEVVNAGDLEVTNLQIAVTLIGDAGQVVASGQANAIGVNVLPAGQRTVWAAPISNAPAQWKEERVRPQAVAATAETRAAFAAGLTVERAEVNPPADPAAGLTVAGLVRNSGTGVARFPLVTVGCYDAAGKLIMVDSGPAQQQEIAPGATAPYQVAVPNLKEPPAKVAAYARAAAVR